MKILLELKKGNLKHEVVFTTTPDDHVIIHEFNLAVVDLQIDKEYHLQSPEWKRQKLLYWRSKLYDMFSKRAPGGPWELVDYSWLDYP